MIAGFKKFIMQGNVVDLAVGIVIGTAFAAVIAQFTTSFIDPIVKAMTGGGVEGGRINIGDELEPNYLDYGAFINAIITFVATMAAIYFFVVVPMNKIKERRAHAEEPEDPSNEEKMVALLEEIAKR